MTGQGTLAVGKRWMPRTNRTAPEDTTRLALDRFSADEQLLARAAALVRQGWCQRCLAEDRNGHPVEPWSESACRWSPLGALTKGWHESGGGTLEVFRVAYASLALATGGRLETWNAAPWRTKWHVLSAFYRARDYLPQARQQVRAGSE